MFTWLEHRTGIRKFLALMLLEGVPGGARWRYVWGSCLAFVFSIQLITGLMLMTAYSPSASQAWSSVHFIQYKMDFGWLIRGLHHFGSQTMMILIGLHMLQVVIAGAHLPPREFNWWTGLALLGVTFGLSLTGYLLPWDQKGYWATRVATNIMGNIPEMGSFVKQQAVGGPDSGNHTLTRFYGMHVAILPGALIALLVVHIYVFRRHGVTSRANVEGLVTKPENEHAKGSETFWPRQMFYDLVMCLVIFGIMLGLVLYGFSHKVETPNEATPETYEYWAHAGQYGKGADLDAPADRQTTDYPARPEWYFLFLFQLLKYFPADVGSFYIPNGIVVFLALLPLLGYGPMRKFGHFVGVLVMMTLLILIIGLTALAFRDDTPNGVLFGLLKNEDPEAIKHAEQHETDVKNAERLAERACQIAMAGSPVEGGHVLMRSDPLTAGRKAFKERCGGCHSFSAREGIQEHRFFEPLTDGKTASDLGDFGSEKWTRGLLADPMNDKYFGLVKKNGEPALTGMRGWKNGVKSMREEKQWNKEQIAKQEGDFDTIAKWLVDRRKPEEKDRDPKLAEAGLKAFTTKANKCASCHNLAGTDANGDSGPDLTGYGSAEWIRAMIMRPGHPSRYGEKNLMPTFRNTEGPGATLLIQELRETVPPPPGTRELQITPLLDVDRELIIRWMLRDYRPVFGGSPIR